MARFSFRSKLLLLLAGAAVPFSGAHAQSFTPEQLQAATALQERIPNLDNHLDIPFDFGTGAHDPGQDGPDQFDFVKAKRGRLKGAVLAIFVPQNARTPAGYAEAAAKGQQKLDAIQAVVRRYPQQTEIARSPEELLAIEGSGRVAIILSILNGNLIGKDLSQLDAWHAKGVSIFGFTHAGNNDLADSARPNLLRGDKLNEHGGLSPLGRQAVARLNDLGVVIDVSQITAQGVRQVLELSRAPVIASHSNARAVIDHPRNLDDETLRAIAAKGGVVAINAYSSWVKAFPPEALAKLNEIRRRYGIPEDKTPAGIQPLSDKGVKVLPPEVFAKYSEEFHEITGGPDYRASLKDYVDQIDYVVKKIGIDHVGISSDFNHGGGVIGWNDVGESVNITAELQRRGYSEGDIAKLWGGNFLRVWGQVQALAKPKASQ
ncbi:dipeptidase [Sphingomonas sp. Sphisp140]|uniref:dipeptidase n=1 Tax=unclassified Sphingomonas TaxID=196159 RepID=UPI0039B11812